MITLAKWAVLQYGEDAPTIQTLRRWCRDAKIFPIPEKHGRTYYVEKSARYVGNFNDASFMGRVRDAATTL